jgi:hypothetical protein
MRNALLSMKALNPDVVIGCVYQVSPISHFIIFTIQHDDLLSNMMWHMDGMVLVLDDVYSIDSIDERVKL